MNSFIIFTLTIVLVLMIWCLLLLTNLVAQKEGKTMLDVKIKYLSDIKPIDAIEIGDWIDLRSAEDITLEAGEFYMLKLGVAMELPKGYSAIVVPRSSAFSKWHIIQTNSIGIIDESYCGDNDEWHMPILAIKRTRIHKNDRICQFTLIPKCELIELHKVSKLNNKNRGGLGSTGKG